MMMMMMMITVVIIIIILGDALIVSSVHNEQLATFLMHLSSMELFIILWFLSGIIDQKAEEMR